MSGAFREDAKYMNRALELARRGEGRVSPNPMVGCVIVKNGKIIGEGWHEGAGHPHAEINALNQAGCDIAGADVYVTLEPCAHQGKTGPCADALIEARVQSVAYAVGDPDKKAAGGGARLKAAGIRVRAGLCEAQARRLNEAWFHFIETGRPFITGKTASSLDGRIATQTGESQWITSAQSRTKAQAFRKRADAIIVGANTVATDNPSLTARDEEDRPFENIYQPLRVVLDSAGRTDPAASIFSMQGRGALLAATSKLSTARRAAFEKAGAEVAILPASPDGRVDLPALAETLAARGCCAAMVEGGGETLGAFLKAGLIDRLYAFVAVGMIIGADGKPSVSGLNVSALSEAVSLRNILIEPLGNDLLISGAPARR
ncbi:bifunctional diaminohydroxyphosphoribosylaminopyrimidine deaminase/5-amino-6-(5-phosphoribosylamino)uracil reductase RibD [Hyphococcus sp.]|uniref:bifunctional diaminohydroxyphosphoribosylaminopyrimidine deaminase/5-amino-6-(5-phosphoribosylamino)uracil reductase RibD n=1 Tax=Hyphococcus sp. TaxID=2038636 RepID=UPI003CCB8A86